MAEEVLAISPPLEIVKGDRHTGPEASSAVPGCSGWGGRPTLRAWCSASLEACNSADAGATSTLTGLRAVRALLLRASVDEPRVRCGRGSHSRPGLRHVAVTRR
jgi:hypothetical protein